MTRGAPPRGGSRALGGIGGRGGAALILLALLTAWSPAQAAPRAKVSSPLLRMARPGAWIPVTVDLEADGPLRGEISVRFAGGEDGEPTLRAFDLPQGGRRRVVVPQRVPDWGYTLEVSVRDRRGHALAEERIDVQAGAMSPEALRVVVVGEDPLAWPTLHSVQPGPVPGHPDVAEADFRPVVVENLLPPDLPTEWFAWSSVDLVIWPRPDPAALSPEQQRALSGWIAAGGTALVALADDHRRWTDSPLAALAPLTASGMITSPSARDVLRTLAGSRGALPDSAPLPIVDLAPLAPTEALLSDDAGQPLVLRAPVGAGALVLCAFDPSAGELKGRVDRELLWRHLFGLWDPREGEATVEEPGLIPGSWQGGPGCPDRSRLVGVAAVGPALGALSDPSSWWSELRQHLVAFEGAAPLTLGFILAFGLLYLLCIGPLDYFILRRLGRPMATWITFPLLALGFSGAAAVVVRGQKGAESELSCLELHDVLPRAGLARRTSWCGLWAGRRADVALRPALGVGFVVPGTPGDYQADGWVGDASEAINGDDLRVRQEPGQSGLDFEAAQWSASVVRGAWEAASSEGASWSRGADGVVVQSDLDADLVEAVVVDRGRWWAVGDLPSGSRRAAVERSERPAIEDDALETAWALLADPVEDFGGHLHPGAAGPMLLGFSRGPAGVSMTGLPAEQRSIILVRVPLPALPEDR